MEISHIQSNSHAGTWTWRSVALFGVLTLVACGHGNSGPTGSSTYTIGGTVSGLSSTGLVLQNNGDNNLPVGADGSFLFTTDVASGGAYNVTVFTQPASLAQSCNVTNGSGTASANVTNIRVTCITAPGGHKQWTWMSGSNMGDQLSIYGTEGMPAPDNVPGGRQSSVTWIDASGNLWLFGGSGYSSGGGNSEAPSGFYASDLWRYAGGQWAWMGGSNLGGQRGTYGILATAAASNVPGGRSGSVGWTDADGNFWLFGGTGIDSGGTLDLLNDLWMYSAGQWTWMGGSKLVDRLGMYGTEGTPASDNIPRARSGAVAWNDASGNFWLFGGYGYASAGSPGYLNDLWRYSAGQWTWMGGSNVVGQPGMYGTAGTPTSANIPGGRSGAVAWTDADGNFWLFSGFGVSSQGFADLLNDLWKYSAGQWTWMGGSKVLDQLGTYGLEGVPAQGNIPGARTGAVVWTDAAGNFWLFGGTGFGSAGAPGVLQDLWKNSSGQWAWMGGANTVAQLMNGSSVDVPVGVYGIEGMPSPGNIPGGRSGSVAWTDAVGNLWLFGGSGYASAGAVFSGGHLNDVWMYEP